MEIEIRPPRADELDAVLSNDGRAFGITYRPEDLEDIRGWLEFDRFFIAADGDEVVGATGTWTFELALPGGAVPCGGVTWVSVSATHRRRGVLRRLMDRQLDHIIERGEMVGALTASESGIYERFGYGTATMRRKLVVDRRFVALRPDLTVGGVRYVDNASARKVLPALYDRLFRQVPGTVSRNDIWWDYLLHDPEYRRDGGTELTHAVHDDGYVTYRVHHEFDGGHVANRVVIREVVALTPAAYAALWGFVLGLDLVRRIEWSRAAVDEPLRWMVTDPRQVRTEFLDDDIWVRPADVVGVLTGRRYATGDRFVLEVVDPSRPAIGGRFEVEGGPDGAACQRTTAEPDLTLGVSDLGSLALGGVEATLLARAGRVTEHTAGSLRRADAFFVSEPKPHNTTGF